MIFGKFSESLDADELIGKTYTFRISATLAGDSVTSIAIIEVDSASLGPAPVPLITISAVSLGVISGTTYGGTFRAQGKGAVGRTYVRCRYLTALGNGDDVTYQLTVEQR